MCGFAGAISFNEKGIPYHALTGKAIYSLLHRGPDDEGIVFKDHFSVGHRRLSIIDLSTAARQPMEDESGRYILAYNGEVFNYKELRKELEGAGRKFKSSSDTEVVLHSLIHWGKEAIEKFDGEFAFAFYDTQTKDLMLVRDRHGIKPLYYYRNENVLLFSSELRGLLKYGIPKEIDPVALNFYFHLNYIPSPFSIFKNIFKVEKQKSYWHTATGQGPTTANLHRILEASVQDRLVADVPVGTFLSGGIDSSIITGIASNLKKDLQSFSIGFPDTPLFDETQYARLAAKHLGTKHHAFEVRNKDLLESLDLLFQHQDEPFADSSALPTQLLCRETAKHLKVVLSGDGADELFAGYNKHEAEWKLSRSSIPSAVLKGAGALLSTLPSSRESKTGNIIRKAKKYTSGAGLSREERYWEWAGFKNGRSVLKKEIQSNAAYQKNIGNYSHLNGEGMNAILLADQNLVLENDMLVKVDRMSMANSLEVRVPFLSNEVVEYARSIPAELKISEKGRKLILKEAFSHLLPKEIMERKKQGFEVPLLQWFRGELKGLIETEINNTAFLKQQNIFDHSQLLTLHSRLNSSDPGDSPATIYAFLVFQNWYRNYFKN